MFAIIATGGKQINVEVGKEYFVEKLNGSEKDKVIFDQVLMIDGQIGAPLIKGAQVHAEVIKQDKAKKIIVFKYKPKKNSKTKYGHRQPYTKVKITAILLDANEPKAQVKVETLKATKVAKESTNKDSSVKKPVPKTKSLNSNEKSTVKKIDETKNN